MEEGGVIMSLSDDERTELVAYHVKEELVNTISEMLDCI